MPPIGRRALIGALGAAATVPLAGGAAHAADEPPSGLRLNEFWAHDAFVVADRSTGTYHLYHTTPEESAEPQLVTFSYRSRDLVSWQGPYVVFRVPEGNWATAGGWAPEVHHYRGRWYLFVTLHDADAELAAPPEVPYRTHRRGTIVAVGDSPGGPFTPLNLDRPHTPDTFMALDGTLFVERGQPWLVYAHEWVQRLDGTMEAIRLTQDLAGTVGDPVHLFKASDALGINQVVTADAAPLTYVTDGPQFHRSRTGDLLMLWSTWMGPSGAQYYVQTQARSASGTLAGPWEQRPVLVEDNSGHGMPFRAFDGTLLMVLHHPFGSPDSRAQLYELHDAGDRFELGRRRRDLDGGDL
ncbi:glycoside hydrolase [Streptomyces sp. 8K308]|uniref:glycoside hydrolase family 43 protein n=1 Tax=Streptomyces sp. 8K308 TaxID=2530388 RepID=UPI0010474D29|nr:glycoside hydrolase family 43 protein [Streptomyces sp. 8K308]TDC22763.1 glycoside hydrolase [Streptomyces sp. 8K308]